MKALQEKYGLDAISAEDLKLVGYAKRSAWRLSINIAPNVSAQATSAPILVDRINLCIDSDKHIERQTASP
jgi:hypothetical protein